jgi:hypothetical protein
MYESSSSGHTCRYWSADVVERAAMNHETVLLRVVVDGDWERWRWMKLDEFLRQINIESWNSREVLVGMVLAPARTDIAADNRAPTPTVRYR